jgi:spore coat protein U domain-containing protein, fimbrial subunit CupE1/2/3/6
MSRDCAARPRRSRPCGIAVWLAAAGLLGASPGAVLAAMRCDVTVLPFAFGLYTPGTPTPLDVTNNIDVRCVGGLGIFWAQLSTGSSGSFAAREMQSGSSRMLYNFYVNAGRTLVWGDGTGGSLQVPRLKLSQGRTDYSLPVYGRVPASQSVAAGAYVDQVIVTIVF